MSTPARPVLRPSTVATGLIVGVLAVLGSASPVAADPAGPTDYRSEIVEVVPATSEIDLAILGGDSFVELAAGPGIEVMVIGYRGEPYLWFDRDGTVWHNERSSSRWLNDDRFGEADVPPEADDRAEPEWVTVAEGGVYAWHDHRAHWMNPVKPIGAEPGDIILEAVIPIDVDGQGVDVHVRSELLASPSPAAALAGATVGGVGGLVALARWRRRRSIDDDPGDRPPGPVGVLLAVIVAGGSATAVGVAAVVGLPSQAAPGPSRWLLPLVAVVVALAALYLGRGNRVGRPLVAKLLPAGLALAGLELVLWTWLRRAVLTRPLVPSPTPEWIDRVVVAGAAAVGLVALAAAALAIRERRPAPRPTP